MARPPRDPTGSRTGAGSMHLGLRLSKHRADQLKRVVEHANAVAVAAGLPPAFTASALVSDAIYRWLDEETGKLDKLEKRRK